MFPPKKELNPLDNVEEKNASQRFSDHPLEIRRCLILIKEFQAAISSPKEASSRTV